MTQTFFFYDLETSGLSPRDDRIMQFAGQRTDLDLNPIGEPVNLLVALDEDTLPSPGALMVTKITPLQTRLDGLAEREFCDYVQSEIFTPGTIATGYNSVHFDDEFMRFTFWRNFFDSYEWQWKDGRSRWDLLDVVRMTRALRPEGIEWPFEEKVAKRTSTAEGRGEAGEEAKASIETVRGASEDAEVKTPDEVVQAPSNRLELLSKVNGIKHEHAHDALSDVFALIGVTKLLKEKQPQLYQYLFDLRDKKRAAELIDSGNPFVYTSGFISSDFAKTSVVCPFKKDKHGNTYVVDLRYEPAPEHVYKVCPNKCPAIAPLGVLEKGDGWRNIRLDLKTVKENLAKFQANPVVVQPKIAEIEGREYEPAPDVEASLYDGFLQDGDRALLATVRAADKNKLKALKLDFDDRRLPGLFAHYKAKNYPEILTADELKEWERYRLARLNRQAPAFLKELEVIQNTGKTSRGVEADPDVVQALADWYQNLQSVDYD